MKNNFGVALKAVLVNEGGYVNNPKDPGGATNKGVTQAVYDAYRARQCDTKRAVRLISDDEIHAIYKLQYWDSVRGDDLPAGVDYAVFDFAVNSGVVRAAKALQRCAKVADDGHIGLGTLAAVTALDRRTLVDQVCAARLGFMRSLRTLFVTFGKGWTARVAAVQAKARGMAA